MFSWVVCGCSIDLIESITVSLNNFSRALLIKMNYSVYGNTDIQGEDSFIVVFLSADSVLIHRDFHIHLSSNKFERVFPNNLPIQNHES